MPYNRGMSTRGKRTPRGEEFSAKRPSVPLDHETAKVIAQVAAEHGLSEAEVMSRVLRWMAQREPIAWSIVMTPLPDQLLPTAVSELARELLQSRGLDEFTVTISRGDGARREAPPGEADSPGGRPSSRRAV
jgi:hypothetical protein